MSYPYQPPSSRQRWILNMVLYSLILIVASSFTTYAVVHGFVPSQQAQQFLTSSGVLSPTPTQEAIKSSDFPTFLNAFEQLLKQKQYAALQDAVDTDNFMAAYMRPSPFPYAPTNPGPYNWQAINQAMLTERYTYTVLLPPLLPDQAGYSCFGYTQAGITWLGLAITATQLQYVVGTAWKPGPVNDPYIIPNSTVFVFELLSASATWLWRAVTFNNALGCGG